MLCAGKVWDDRPRAGRDQDDPGGGGAAASEAHLVRPRDALYLLLHPSTSRPHCGRCGKHYGAAMSSSDASGGDQRRLRVLVLSRLYPNAAFERMDEVTERQTRWLASLPDADVEVAAPVMRYPFPLRLRNPPPLPPRECWNGVPVHRQAFTLMWRSWASPLSVLTTLVSAFDALQTIAPPGRPTLAGDSMGSRL